MPEPNPVDAVDGFGNPAVIRVHPVHLRLKSISKSGGEPKETARGWISFFAIFAIFAVQIPAAMA